METAGEETFRPNRGITNTYRFADDEVTIRSGGTIRFVDRDRTRDPHTISIVRRRDLPRSFECPACEALEQGHFPNGFEGEPVPVLDQGRPGLDAPGDSLLWGDRQRLSAKVSARPGTTLSFLCVPHPWMQGRIKVVR